MDEYTDGTYQGPGFSGERMGNSQAAPYTSAPPAASPAPSPPQPTDWTSTVPRNQTTWTEPHTGSGDTMGLMVQGLLIGAFFGIFGLAGIALLSASEKRGDRFMGGIIGFVLAAVGSFILLVA